MNITLSQEDYEALIALGRKGLGGSDEVRNFEAFLNRIEKANNIKRHLLWVQWQEADAPLPAGANFPRSWPPNLRGYIELLTRPITRQDVEYLLDDRAKKPVGVLVTPDPAAVVGWTKLDDYFVR